MRARARGVVEQISAVRDGAQEVAVRVGETRRAAVVYPDLTGPVSVGDEVLVNTVAVELELGTGGVDFVCAVMPGDAETVCAGHIMKLRYTPLQIPVLAAEAPESPHHDTIATFESLRGRPVVCAELHSQVPAVAAATKWETRGAARIVYVMTDSAALPMGFSRLVRELRERGLIDATVTVGQAFGGDYECVNLYSGLACAADVAGGDVIVVSPGPGSTGTDTPLGFSGVDQGLALNAAASLDGTGIAVVRLSFADPRPRHAGISHHTCTVLRRIALQPALVPIPRLPFVEHGRLRDAIDEAGLLGRHEFITVDAQLGFDALMEHRLTLSTMGRSAEQEREFYLSAAAAGLVAGQCAGCETRTALTPL